MNTQNTDFGAIISLYGVVMATSKYKFCHAFVETFKPCVLQLTP